MPVRRRLPTVLLAQLALSLLAPAAFGHPSSGIVVDEQGRVFFGDLSRGLTCVEPGGEVRRVHAEAGHWLALDAAGRFADVDFEKSPHWPRWFKRRTAKGAKPALITDGGSPLVVAPDGNLYYACDDERMVPGGLQIGRLSPDGTARLVNPALRKLCEALGGIKGLATGRDGSIYASFPRAVGRISLAGEFSKLAGEIVAPDCDKHPPNITDAPSLRGLAVDARGAVYAAATGCRCVIRIAPGGAVTTVLKAEAPWSPSGVALRGDDLYVLEHVNANSEVHEDWPPRVRRVGRDGKVTTLVDLSRKGVRG